MDKAIHGGTANDRIINPYRETSYLYYSFFCGHRRVLYNDRLPNPKRSALDYQRLLLSFLRTPAGCHSSNPDHKLDLSWGTMPLLRGPYSRPLSFNRSRFYLLLLFRIFTFSKSASHIHFLMVPFFQHLSSASFRKALGRSSERPGNPLCLSYRIHCPAPDDTRR